MLMESAFCENFCSESAGAFFGIVIEFITNLIAALKA